jgi:hypothetical protein
MSFLDILPVVGSIFGKKDKGTQQFADNTATTTGSTTGKTNQDTNSTTRSSETDKQTSVNKGFSAPVLGQIETMLTSLLGSQAQAGNQRALDARTAELAGRSDAFDTAAFVNDLVSSAATDLSSTRQQNINNLASKAGGGVDGNSMLALLGGQLARQDAATLAGIKGAATKEAAAISTGMSESLTGQLSQTAAASNNMLTSILSVLAGQNATSQTTGQKTSLVTELERLLQTSSGTTSSKTKTDYKGV